MRMSDLVDCMTSQEDTTAELRALEDKLAVKYALPRGEKSEPVRRRLLLALDRVGALEEDEAVTDWRATYARYLESAEPEQWATEPCETSPRSWTR